MTAILRLLVQVAMMTIMMMMVMMVMTNDGHDGNGVSGGASDSVAVDFGFAHAFT